MVKIVYTASRSGLENGFYFAFSLKECGFRPRERIREGKGGAELFYFLELLRKERMLEDTEESRRQDIWSSSYGCRYQGRIPFTMIYDESYDTVSFAVDEAYLGYREEIAEAIRKRMLLSAGEKL